MDKAEYQSRLDSVNQLVKNGDYSGALEIVETIDWRRVKSIRTLTMVADVYEQNKMYEEEQNILLIAYDRSTLGKALLYRLTEVAVRLKDFEGAKEYYNEYVKVAGHDISRYILKYEIYRGTGEPLEKQIQVLEEYTQLEFEEKWAFELATLYSKNGQREKCLQTCDDLILWFNEGKYVIKALKLKKKYGAITPSQNRKLEQLLGAAGSGKEARSAAAAGPVVMKSTESIQENVAQDIRTVFPSRPKEVEEIIPAKENQAEYIDPSEYEVRDLEPESLSIQVNPEPDARATIKTKPVKKVKEYEELDLEALFAETASGFSEEVNAQTNAKAEQAEETEPEILEEEDEAEEEEDTFSLEDAIVAALVREEREIAEKKKAAEEKADKEPDNEAAVTEDTVIEEAVLEEPVIAESAVEETESTESETVEMEAAPDPDVSIEDVKIGESPEQMRGEEPEALLDLNALLLDKNPAEAEEDKEPSMDELIAADQESASADEVAFYKDPLEEAMLSNQLETLEDEVVWDLEKKDSLNPYAESIALSPEKMNIEVPSEPRKEAVTDATIAIPDPRNRKIVDKPIEEKKPNADGVIPMSVEEVLREETEEERRLRILNEERPEKLNDEQKKLFTYFMKVPGMEEQIVAALNHVYDHAGERTSREGNIAIMGGYGTGKTRLFDSVVRAICCDMKLSAAKIARLDASVLNSKDPAQIVAKMSGGFLLIERAGLMYPETIQKLTQAMNFRTDRLVIIIEDEKVSMRGLLHNYPDFAEKFGTVISIPVFTNDELVTFAKTYARENGYRMDEMGVLALYTKIGENQKEGEPMTITAVKEMVDGAIHNAQRGTRKFGRKLSRRHTDVENRVILYEKDFE